MAASPILLVADDLALIAAVKRVLAREGYECVLATNAADAVIAWGHGLPGLVLLQPSVESDRGGVLLEELQLHPDAQLLRVVLLGETVPGFAWPVEPLPLDGAHLAEVIEENVRAPVEATGWSVREAPPGEAPPAAPEAQEPEAWRLTAPRPVTGPGDAEVPEATALAAPPTALDDKLFADAPGPTAPGELEAPAGDEELARLEAEVREEARRRRASREARAAVVTPSAPEPEPAEDHAPPAPSAPSEETSFADVAEEAAPPPSRAAEVLERAERLVTESRAGADARHRDDDSTDRAHREALAHLERRAEAAEATLAAAREAEAAAAARAQGLEAELAEAQRRAEDLEAELDRAGDSAQLAAQREATLEATEAERAGLERRLAEAERAHAATTAELGALRDGLASETDQRGSLEQQLLEARAALAGESSRRAALETERDLAQARGAELELIAAAAREEAAQRHALTDVLATRDHTIQSLEAALATARGDADAALALASEVEGQQLTASRAELEVTRGHLAETRAARDAAQAELLTTELARDELQHELDDARGRLEALQADVTSAGELLEETARERDTLRARVAALEPEGARLAAALETEQARREEAEAAGAELRSALEAATDARATLEQELAALRDSRSSETVKRTQAETDLTALREALAAEVTRREQAERDASLQRDAFAGEAALREQAATELHAARASAEAAERDAAALRDALAVETARAAQADAELTRVRVAAEASEREAAAQGRTLAEETTRREQAERDLALEQEALALETQRREAAEKDATARAELEERLGQAHAAHAAETGLREELARELAQVREVLETETRLREEVARELAQARADAAHTAGALKEALATEVRGREEAEAASAAQRASREAEAAEREKATAELEELRENLEALEKRETLTLTLPTRTLGVPRHGQAPLDTLARVVTQLVLADAEVRLELGVTGGTRTLWFKRGQIVAAESTLETESLIARARRDGLIDARQDAELRMLKGAPPREQLDALKSRGFIRDIESVPLVQRYTEQVALDAFAEGESQYRLAEEAPAAAVLLATVPRPTLPMLAESLRRAVPPDEVLERLGGGEAVAFATDSTLDLRALGFSERERKMLTWVDGEASVEDLSLASGLKPDAAFRALLVARWLGVVELKPGVRKLEPSPGQLDERRLEAKFEELQDADYFTILGLPRSAGADEVRRAFERLSQEFDPLRFSGHPDPGLQQRAQVVADLLEEAAKALEDDRRRVEYARHLLD